MLSSTGLSFMRILGLDVGEKWIGVAMSDPSGTLASPLTRINATDLETTIEAICLLASQHEVARIVSGMPYSLDGSLGPQARRVEGFLQKLSQRLDVPIETWDERYSTLDAQQRMIDAGVKKERIRERIDAAAAAIILQEYLDNMRSP
ncbi:MAG: Holliday junction resolvase RuvX [Chloroflexi bacterium]|nr:Holliday junction resolvase RuvX [Chloroflexota bacterium]